MRQYLAEAKIMPSKGKRHTYKDISAAIKSKTGFEPNQSLR